MKRLIKYTAIDLGAATIGFTTADKISESDHLNDWLSQGYSADMEWLKRNSDARCDPKSILPGARSVICTAFKYSENGIENELTQSEKKHFARFARGQDYHKFVRDRLELVWEKIAQRYPDAKYKICVDTSPILEKALAARAGLGWIGKNSLLINPELGSYFALGEIITTLEILPDKPIESKCDDCTRCVKACPTKAIISPRVLDTRRCVSYLTIESKKPIPEEFKKFVKENQYGCDMCQEVCPYNGGKFNNFL